MDSQTELTEVITLILGTLAMVLMVAALLIFAFLYQRKLLRKEKENQQIEKLLKKEELKSAYALIQGREEERKRISEDLHDNLGSLLSTLRLYSDTLLEKESSTEVKSISERISHIAGQAAEETRRISHDLDAGLLKHSGLETALYQLCEAINTSGKLQVETVLDMNSPIDNDLSLNIYRIVQELFSNTLKHAQATKTRIEITVIANDYISLIFEDNGKGFNPQYVSKGIGLQHLQSRVARFNGQFTIDSSENRGTTTIIEIPLHYGDK